MWLAGPGGRRGIDVADVVADRVGPELSELGAGADADGTAVARRLRETSLRDRDVERLDERLSNRPRALPRGGRLGGSLPLTAPSTGAAPRGSAAPDRRARDRRRARARADDPR